MNPEKIVSFLTRMKTKVYFRNYYISIYDSLRLLHQRIFDCPSLVVAEAEKKWTTKLYNVLDEERRTLERYEDEIVTRREQVAYLENLKTNDLGDRNQWRLDFPKLPTWLQKGKRHAGKRFNSGLDQGVEKKRRVEELQWEDSLERRVRFLSDLEKSDQEPRVICVSKEDEP